jgi:hypothetical protein
MVITVTRTEATRFASMRIVTQIGFSVIFHVATRLRWVDDGVPSNAHVVRVVISAINPTHDCEKSSLQSADGSDPYSPYGTLDRRREERREGLGAAFDTAVDSMVERVAASPLRFRTLIRERRQAGLQRFPCAIYFTF